MKKNFLIVIMAIVAMLCCAVGFTACGDGTESGASDNSQNSGSGGDTAVHEHELTLSPRKDADCKEEGKTEYYTCSGCDKWFFDEDGKTEITNKKSVTLKMTHIFSEGECSVCGVKQPTEGLKYEQVENGFSCVGIGTADTTDIVIANLYDGKPVTAVHGGGSAFRDVTSVYIPEGITIIAPSTFSGSVSLAEVALPSTLETIGSNAFFECSSLKNITLPENLTTVGSSVFSRCTALSEITIPDKVTEIPLAAFDGCKSLQTVNIGKGVISIGAQAFQSCTALKEVVIPDKVTSVGDKAFSSCSMLSRVSIGEKVTSIGAEAFYNCTELTNVTVGDELTSIGNTAFYNCTSLLSIILPASITDVDGNAFRDCNGIIVYCKAESKPEGWNVGSYHIVWNCTDNDVANDGNIYFFENGLKFILKDGKVSVAERQARNLSGGIIIPKKVTYGDDEYQVNSISEMAFYSCVNLTSVTLHDSVTNVGEGAFNGCSAVTIYCEALKKPDGWNNKWNSGNLPVVWNCTNNDIADDDGIYFVEGGVRFALKDGTVAVVDQPNDISGKITLPQSLTYKGKDYPVTSIARSAFSYCGNVTEVVLPDTVTDISAYAFDACRNLAKITFGSGLKAIGNSAFRNCEKLTAISLPDGLISIDSSAFSSCYALTEINIPASVTVFADRAFLNCYSLAEIVIPDGIEEIGDYAFFQCHKLVKVTVPASVKSIGSNAFASCDALGDITFKGTKEEWNSIVKSVDWDKNAGNYTIHCTDGDITKS